MFRSHGNPPSHLLNEVRCIKQEYAIECAYGHEIWADHGSGADADVKV